MASLEGWLKGLRGQPGVPGSRDYGAVQKKVDSMQPAAAPVAPPVAPTTDVNGVPVAPANEGQLLPPAPAPVAPRGAPTVPTWITGKRAGLADTDIMAAATGGDIPKDQPVLVGENGPEVVVPKQDVGVIPNEAAAAGGLFAGGKKAVVDKFNAARQAGAKGARWAAGAAERGWSGLRNAVSSPAAAGRTAASAVNAAEGVSGAMNGAVNEATTAYNLERNAQRGQSAFSQMNRNARIARYGADTVARMEAAGAGAGQVGADVMPNLVGKGGEAAAQAGKFARGLRGLGTIGAVVQGGLMANEAANMTGDVSAGKYAATEDNRGARALRILSGGAITPPGSGIGATPPPPPANTPQSGSVAGPSGDEAKQQAALEVGRLQAQREANVQAASPEAGGTGVSIGGLRGEATTPSASTPEAVRGRAVNAMFQTGAFGASTRLNEKAVHSGQINTELGLRSEANRINAAKAAYDIAKGERAFRTGREDVQYGRNDVLIKNAAQEQAGPVPTSLTGKEQTATHQANIAKIEAKLRGDIQYTLGDTGQKLENVSGQQLQQMFLAQKFRDLNNDARSGFMQSVRDYTGNKRFDSRNLYGFMPTGVERATLPGGGGYLVKLKNGNTAPLVDLGGGNFQWFGPNKPVDADTMNMILPLIQQYEQGKKGK